VLARPVTQANGRNLWTEADVERARQHRVRYRPRQRAQGGAEARRVALRLRRDQSAVARSFFRCWQECGLAVALDAVQRHGAAAGLRNMGEIELGRMLSDLEYAVRLVRGLR